MVSESILGFMNNVVRKCPSASQMYVPSKSCFSLNNTYSWLDSLDDTCLQRATTWASSLNVSSKEAVISLDVEIQRRLHQGAQHRADLRRKQLTRHTKSIIGDVDNFQVNVRNIDSTISLEVVDSALNVVRSPKSLEGRELFGYGTKIMAMWLIVIELSSWQNSWGEV